MSGNGRWWLTGVSVRGAAHLRDDLPNQDAILWRQEKSRTRPAVLAVADGHGSAHCPRSAEGSFLAVSAAGRAIDEFVRRYDKYDTIDQLCVLAGERLSPLLTELWLVAVRQALAKRPLTDEEKTAVADGPPELAYGTTLLIATVLEQHILVGQLGDGDIVAAGTDSVTRMIQHKHLGNETESLCHKKAAQLFIYAALPRYGPDSSDIIMMSTDGYSNSFRTESGFLQAASDLRRMACEQGGRYVATSLRGWLNDTSRSGSGDDITVGLILPWRWWDKRTRRRWTNGNG